MNRSLSLVLKVWEAEAPGAGMNMIFRDILEALVKRNILSERDRKKIWEAWGKWRGRLEEFITEVLPDMLNNRQYRAVITNFGK